MYSNTLFVVEEHASVAGIASGLVDLASLGAFEVEVEKYRHGDRGLERAREHGARRDGGLVAYGLSGASDVDAVGLDTVENAAIVYLDIAKHSRGPAIHQRGAILEHVLVASDFTVRSGCTTACLANAVSRGVGRVTLLHVPAPGTARCPGSSSGELGCVDLDWFESLKRMMFKSGAEEVDFLTPDPGHVAEELRRLVPTASLVIVGSGCSERVTAEYRKVARPLIESGNDAPALFITAADCTRLAAESASRRAS